eukprot:11711899-Alexandrium_andersonii.AAC.1
MSASLVGSEMCIRDRGRALARIMTRLRASHYGLLFFGVAGRCPSMGGTRPASAAVLLARAFCSLQSCHAGSLAEHLL